ncbi:MAG TPA: hypothetical protein VN522_03430 [Solirubrobacterales bacterium]|nr:hypothetical protein [Solirubrobacterales bacterium]
MSLRKLGAAVFAVLAIGAVTADNAFAAPTTGKSHWNVNVAKLSGTSAFACSSTGTFSLKSSIAGSPLWLTANPVSCLTPNSLIANTTVSGVEMAVDSGEILFDDVIVMEPAGCVTYNDNFLTEKLASNIEMDGSTVYDRFVAAAPATQLSVIALRECAAEGNYKLTGFLRALWPYRTGEEKYVNQLTFNSTSNAVSELKMGGNAATLEGTLNVTLTSGATFSASE